MFIAVEKSAPYAVSVFDLSRAAINEGRKEYIRLLQLYMECREQDHWPAYNPDIQEISLPGWALKRGEFSFAA